MTLFLYYKFRIKLAILKYTSKLQASTIVVIKGLAITAGSKPIFLASIGSEQPITLAMIIVIINVRQTHNATRRLTLSIIKIFMKLHIPKVIAQHIATLASLKITRHISLKSISFKDKALMILTLA